MVFLHSLINLKKGNVLSLLCGKYYLIHLETVKRPKNEIITLKSYLKQDNIAPPPHNIILFQLDFNVKFPLLRLLQVLIDLKSTI